MVQPITRQRLLAATLCASSLTAASPAQEEVVVTANRVERPLSTIPNTVTVIDQAALEQQISVSNDLSTVLGNLIPSFSPSRQKLTSSGESLRGRNPLYMVDGVPQSNPLRDGARDAHTIAPIMLERVEVIHGANAIHGLGASGGIINLITKKPGDEPTHSLRFDTLVQDQEPGDSASYGATYSFSGRFDAIDVLTSLSYRKNGVGYDADGDVVGFDNTQGDTMDAQTLNGFLKTGYDWNDQRIELTFNRYDLRGDNDWLAVPGDVSAGIAATARETTVPGDAPRNEVTLLSLNYSNAEWFGHSVSVLLFAQDFSATYGGGVFATFQDPALGTNIFDQSQNNSEKTGLKLTLVKDAPGDLPLNIVYGVDLFEDSTWQELAQTGREWVPETTYENIAPFAQLEYSGIDDVTVTAGLRYEKSSLKVDDFTTLASYGSQFVVGGEPDFSERLHNIGATYQISDNWRLFGNLSEGFSMPDVGRVLRGINQPNQNVETFLSLEPIVTDNREIGFEFTGTSLRLQMSYYSSDSDFGQRLQADANGIFSVQREKTEIDGVELRSEWQLNTANTLGLRYARTRGEYDSNGDGRVDTDLDGTNIAPDRLNLSWDRSWSDTVSSRVQINHLLDRRFENSSGTTVAQFDGYTTVDASAEIIALEGVFSLGIHNLANKDYFTYYAQTRASDNLNFKGFGRSISLAYQRSF
ncbi:MAG TPA: TonB-dependent receptor [Spongiibacteraceae bacterium]|nr:TonB-dependent receptor [Spongiibacteraceae bacterium]HCS28469.1 TonB-dependent receptor [Spongiibacteraceae bacterium]